MQGSVRIVTFTIVSGRMPLTVLHRAMQGNILSAVCGLRGWAVPYSGMVEKDP